MTKKSEIHGGACPHYDLNGVSCLQPTHDRETLDAMRLAFHRQGALSLKGVFPRDLIQRLKAAYFDEYAVIDKSTRSDVGDGDRYMCAVEIRTPFDHPLLYDSPLLFPVLRSILHNQVIIQSFGIVSSMPGSRQQQIHMDHPDLFKELSGFNKVLPCYALTVAIPLIDLDEQTGTTAIWLESHRDPNLALGQESRNNYEGAILPYPQAGDCVLWDYRTFHSGTENKTSRERPLLYLTVSRPWFDDTANFENLKGRFPLILSQGFIDATEEKHLALFPRAKIVCDR